MKSMRLISKIVSSKILLRSSYIQISSISLLSSPLSLLFNKDLKYHQNYYHSSAIMNKKGDNKGKKGKNSRDDDDNDDDNDDNDKVMIIMRMIRIMRILMIIMMIMMMTVVVATR